MNKSIALRFAENFAPECGTIEAHERVIEEFGYVWYGKMGSRISQSIAELLLTNDDPKILLIRSGKVERYWAHIDKVSFDIPKKEAIPKYYRDKASDFGCWFRVRKFERAPRDVLGKCYVSSSKKPLAEASKYSMSPYFIIEIKE